MTIWFHHKISRACKASKRWQVSGYHMRVPSCLRKAWCLLRLGVFVPRDLLYLVLPQLTQIEFGSWFPQFRNNLCRPVYTFPMHVCLVFRNTSIVVVAVRSSHLQKSQCVLVAHNHSQTLRKPRWPGEYSQMKIATENKLARKSSSHTVALITIIALSDVHTRQTRHLSTSCKSWTQGYPFDLLRLWTLEPVLQSPGMQTTSNLSFEVFYCVP